MSLFVIVVLGDVVCVCGCCRRKCCLCMIVVVVCYCCRL